MDIKYNELFVNPLHVVLYKFITCYVQFVVQLPTGECLVIRTLRIIGFPVNLFFLFEAGDVIEDSEK